MRTDLAPPPGVVSDNTDYSTQGWVDCSGCRFRLNGLETTGGWERLSLTDLTGVCRTAFEWYDLEGRQSVAFGLHNGLTVWQGGDQADVTPSAFVTGNIDGGFSNGFGTGSYGRSTWGSPTTDDNFPLTWSFGSRYGVLYGNPRGQGIFVWENDLGDIAEPLTDAPAVCNFMLCAWTGQIFALGCTNVGGTFDASCIRISDVEDPTEWTPGTATTAQQYLLDGGGRIVGARAIGESIFIWTISELHEARYDGSEWVFSRIGVGGLAGPNAAVVKGQVAYWIGPDLQFYVCPLGGGVQILPCPIRTAFRENAAASQNDKIVAATINDFDEVVWFYADSRDGLENSRALRFSPDGWAPDILARTAFTDGSLSPIGVTYEGQIYWHERGNSADGGQKAWFAETGWQYIEPAQNFVLATQMRPDIKDQIGAITLTITTRRAPQDDDVEREYLIIPNQRKVDLRSSGLLAKFRFEGNSSPSYARLGKQNVEFQITGRR